MSTALKTIHDQLLLIQPEGASHDASECPVCSDGSMDEVASDSTPSGGSVSEEKTYSEAEYTALAAQVEDLKAKVTELTAAAEVSEVDAKVAEARAELEAQVADLRTKLDAAVLESETVKKNHTEVLAYLETAKTEAEEAAAREARKAERVEQVKEIASFPESYLEENADRYADMDEETFEFTLEGYRAQKAALEAAAGESSDKKDDEIPAATAMTAARSNDGSSPKGLLTDVLGMRFQGADPRTL
jgi:chromosome segregation ATPase